MRVSMMSELNHVLTFDTFDDIHLYELTETARNSNYKKLAEWMYEYKRRQIEDHNRRYGDQTKKEYEHEFNVLIGLVDSFETRASRKNEFSIRSLRETWKTRKRIRFISNEIFSHVAIGEANRNVLRSYLRQNRFGSDFKAFLVSMYRGGNNAAPADRTAGGHGSSPRSASAVDSKLNEFIEKMFRGKEKLENQLVYIDPQQFLSAYEEKLRDHIFLLEDLIEILNIEYDRRVISTKTRFEEYLLPRKRVLEKIEEEIDEIGEDIKFLAEDESVSDEDREKLANAFASKRAELEEIKKAEFEKLSSIRLISANIKNGVRLFKDLIDNLRKKLRYFKKRQFYVERLARYGADIPKLRNVLDVLYSTFNNEIKSLQKSFLLFDISFQKTIFTAIDDQSIINRIVLSPRGIIDAELAIESSPPQERAGPPADFSRAEQEIMDGIEDDLSFLAPYDEKAGSGK
jgi:CII-binding regulator of phage lambda lysogenization HflD